MTTGLSGQRPRPIIAVVGESQVGKSSLVNALIGARLLPTTGAGTPRSQAPCECVLPGLPTPEGCKWTVEAELMGATAVEDAVARPNSPRGRLLRRGLEAGSSAYLANAWRSLRLNGVASNAISGLAVGRDTSWLELLRPVATPEARRQIGPLAGDWPAAIAKLIRVVAAPGRATLVDLPGVGHSDAGGEAARSWLDENSERVAGVVCVVGQGGLGDALANLLKHYWRVEDLGRRLYVVATFGDRLVGDPEDAAKRARAAHQRRNQAARQAAALLHGRYKHAELVPRTYCIDPRPNTRAWAPVKVCFDGELQRLRTALGTATPPILPLRPPALPTPPAPDSRRRRPANPTPPSPEPPRLGLRPGETMRTWLARVYAPLLLRPEWNSEPAKRGCRRHVLTCRSAKGRSVRVVTISGSGKAWFGLTEVAQEIPRPASVDEAGLLLTCLVKVAMRHDLTAARAKLTGTKG